MSDTTDDALSASESRDLRHLAGFMVPADDGLGLPGADDETIFADIVRSLGRDFKAVRQTLAELQRISGGSFADLTEAKAEEAAMALLNRQGPVTAALGQAVLQCYYRDRRVFLALGREYRPPFPKGHALEQGDFGLLDMVRGRPRMWRDLEDAGASHDQGGER
jgi:hypothetical protein